MHVLRAHMALQNLDVERPTNLTMRSLTSVPMSPVSTGLRYFVMNTK